jgi:hypothetical protein
MQRKPAVALECGPGAQFSFPSGLFHKKGREKHGAPVILQHVVPFHRKLFVSSSRGGAQVEIARKYFQGADLYAVFCSALGAEKLLRLFFQPVQPIDHLHAPGHWAG